MAGAVDSNGKSSSGLLKLAVAFCLGAAVILIGERAFKSAVNRSTAKPVTHSTAQTEAPWGNLEVTDIPFENSEEIFLDRAARLKKPEWFFENVNPSQVAQLFESAQLNESQKTQLLATNSWNLTASNCVVRPPEDLVASLSSTAREKIYGALALCQSNYAQCFPFRFPPNRFEQRFANSGISANGMQVVRSLCYTNNGLLSFCDLDVASKKLSVPEFDSLIRVLYAVPTVRLRLRITHDENVDKLVKYWGRGGREKRVRPMLESLARLPQGDSVAVAYLLPGAARLRLYTFPDVTRDPTEGREDCFFTALNFFNKYADEKFLDKANTRQTLQSDYTLVSEQPTYGDLITLINSRGDAVHVAVYVAQDVVFTKNGVNLLQPWVLMRMDEMMSYFPSAEPLRIVIFRKKDLTQVATVAR
jgi:hypothetical protein